MIFKRPSFKRGGTPTGIESLTPRVKAQTGFPGMQYYGEPTGPIQTNLPRSQIGLKKTRFPFLKTQFIRPVAAGAFGTGAVIGTGIGALTDFYARSKYTPEGYKRLKEMSEIGVFDETSTGEEIRAAQEYINEGNKIGVAPGFFPRGGKKKFFEDRDLDSETGLPKQKVDINMRGDPAQFTGEDELTNFDEIVEKVVKEPKENKKEKTNEEVFKSEFDKQYNRLEKYLGSNKQEDKGRIALGLAEAIGTPGSIADKAAVLNKTLLNIAAGRKKDKKDLAKLAFAATTEIEKANIMAGKKSFDQQRYEKLFDSAQIVRNPSQYSDAEVKAAKTYLQNTADVQDLLKDKKGAFTLTGATVNKYIEEAPKTRKKLRKELAKGNDADQNKIAEYRYELELADAFLSKDIDKIRSLISRDDFEKGGRVNYALGTPNPNVNEIAKTPSEPVDKLSFQQLRTKLPKEITDDIVRMLVNDDEALQDFAYIRTQGDVNKFNLKYGVSLVLPPESV